MYNDDIDMIGWKTVKWFLICLAIAGALGLLGWIWHIATYPVSQAQAIVERTMNADNVLYNYEWFHARVADYDSATRQVQQKQHDMSVFLESAGPRNTWNYATQQEYNQLNVELSGLRAQRTNIANEYNSHVGMTNRNLFRSRSLPEQLNDANN